MSNYVFNYSHYKQSLNRKKSFNFTLIFLLIILLLFTLTLIKPRNNNKSKFYFINAGSFSTYQPALELSKEIYESGGAGYIYFNGKYNVIISFYSSEKDAEKVLSNLKNDYPSYNVLTISAPNFSKQKNMTNSQNSTIEKLLDQSEKSILKYEKIVADFSLNKSTINQTKLEIENLHSELKPYCEKFMSKFMKNSKLNIAKDYVNKMLNSIRIDNIENLTNVISVLRYNLVSFIINRNHLLSCF